MREGWKEVGFGKVVQFPPKISMKKGESYPFIPMEVLESGKKYVKPQLEKPLDGGGAKFEEGDTLFARITPCLQNGKISQAKGLNGKPGFGSTEYFIFRGIEEISDSDFIYYLTLDNWFKDKAIGSMVGASGRQRADGEFLRNIQISLPPLPTQRKIASILSAYDDLIENNLKRIKLLEEKAQLTYEEWFVKMRFPGYQTAVFNDETGLTEGWEKLRLGDVIELIVDNRGKNPKYYCESGIPVIDNYLIINRPYVDYSNCTRFIDEHLYDNFIRKYLKPSDVLITLVGNGCGSVSMAPQERCVIIQNTVGLRCNSLCNQHFLYWYLISNRTFIQNQNRGSAQPSVKVGDLLDLKIIIPKSNLINLFWEITKPIFNVIENLANQNRLLKETRDFLLPRLMSGMIDVDTIELNTQQTAKEKRKSELA